MEVTSSFVLEKEEKEDVSRLRAASTRSRCFVLLKFKARARQNLASATFGMQGPPLGQTYLRQRTRMKTNTTMIKKPWANPSYSCETLTYIFSVRGV